MKSDCEQSTAILQFQGNSVEAMDTCYAIENTISEVKNIFKTLSVAALATSSEHNPTSTQTVSTMSQNSV